MTVLRFGRKLLALALIASATSGTVLAQDAELDRTFAAAEKEMPGLSKDLVAGAKKEGLLVIYHLAIPFPPLLAEFSKRFPFIKIETFQGSGPPVFQKFTTEQRAGTHRVDIFQHSDPGQTNDVAREGLLAQYKPMTAAKYPASIKNEGFWYPLALARIGIAYNPTMVSKEEIAAIEKGGWDSAAEPRWKDKAGLIQLVGGAGTAPYYYWYKEKGLDFMKKVFANQPIMFSGNNPAIERLIAGEYGVLFNALEGTAYTQYKNGAPVHYIIPEPVVLVPFTQAIAKTAPHPNAARLFHEWLFSVTGQKTWQAISGYVSGHEDVADTRDVTKEPWYRSGKKLWDWKFDQMVADTPELRGVYEKLVAK
jgi:iron(III) transport system substrate-binding protein